MQSGITLLSADSKGGPEWPLEGTEQVPTALMDPELTFWTSGLGSYSFLPT